MNVVYKHNNNNFHVTFTEIANSNNETIGIEVIVEREKGGNVKYREFILLLFKMLEKQR